MSVWDQVFAKIDQVQKKMDGLHDEGQAHKEPGSARISRLDGGDHCRGLVDRMTPADALIEKMARGMYLAEPIYVGETYVLLEWDGLSNGTKVLWRSRARAAYEAEHEETKG